MSSWTTLREKIYLEYCDERMQNAHAENLKDQYESYVKKKRGQRIFFFDNFKEYLDWQKRDFKIPDAALNHNKGKEYGRKLLQQNAEFFARCFRRDIK